MFAIFIAVANTIERVVSPYLPALLSDILDRWFLQSENIFCVATVLNAESIPIIAGLCTMLRAVICQRFLARLCHTAEAVVHSRDNAGLVQLPHLCRSQIS